MKTKILILIISISLAIGGFFVWKSFILPEVERVEKEIEVPPIEEKPEVSKEEIIPPEETGSKILGPKLVSNTTKSGVLLRDEVWSGEIYVDSGVIVPKGIILTIMPGTIIKFKYDRNYKTLDKGGLEIKGGTIKAIGEKENMIWFTSSAEEPINGDWGGISIFDSKESEFRYVIIEFAEIGIQQFDSAVRVSNSIIRWSTMEGLYAERSKPIFEQNRLYSNGYHEIALEQYNEVIIKNNIFHDGTAAIHNEKTISYIEGNYFRNYKWAAITAGMDSKLKIIGNKFEVDEPYEIYGGSTAQIERDDGFIPELDFPDVVNKKLKYQPGDPEDKYPYIYSDEDETRRVVKKIGAGLSFGFALEYVDGSLYKFSMGSGEIGKELDFIKIDPKTGSYLKYGNDIIMNPRGLAYDGQFFYVNDFSLLKIFKFRINGNFIEILDSFDIPEKEKGGTMGLTTDKEYLYLKSRDGSKLFKLDKKGNVVDEIYLENDIYFDSGIVWTGKYFWTYGGCQKKLCKFSKDGKLVGEIYPAALDPSALTWDGKYLWALYRTCELWDDPKIYQIEILDDSLK